MDDYAVSNSVYAVSHGKFETDAYRKILANEGDRVQLSLELVKHLCEEFCIPVPEVIVAKKYRPKPGTIEIRGTIKKIGDRHRITVYNYATRGAVKAGRQIPADQFLETLIHEFIHYYDHKVLGLSRSCHTGGFYARTRDLALKLA